MQTKCSECGEAMEVEDKVFKAHPRTTSWACDKCAGPDWSADCEVCGARPIVKLTGLCGPCTWGDASTAGGNW